MTEFVLSSPPESTRFWVPNGMQIRELVTPRLELLTKAGPEHPPGRVTLSRGTLWEMEAGTWARAGGGGGGRIHKETIPWL